MSGAAAGLALALALAGCGTSAANDVKAKASDVASAASKAASGAQSAASSAVASAKAVVGTPVAIVILNGKIHAPDVVHLKKGDKVRLLVTSDKADEVHVHLDDSLHPVKANQPTMIVVTASKTGRFDVETHSDDKKLTVLEVK